MRLRLSLLMFLQYAAPGAMLPLFSLYLERLGFSPAEIGWTSAMQAVGSLLAPLVVGQVADRWFAADRCLAVCAAVAGVLLLIVPELATFPAVMAATLAYWLVMAPAITLGTALSFTHLAAPERHYGSVRLWGTVGWMVSSWLLGYWFTNPAWAAALLARARPAAPASQLADAFRLGGGLSFVLAAYALTLPRTPPKRLAGSVLAPVAALGLLRERSFAVFVVGSSAVCLTGAFYSQNVPLLLAKLGVARPWVALTLTIGQVAEVTTMALLPMLMIRLEVRGTMRLGIVAWAAGLAGLALGEPLGLVLAALVTWGAVVSCYLVAGQVFVNGRARGDIRTSTQALLSCCNGMGMLLGNVLAGSIREGTGGALAPVFAVATAIAAGAAVVFLLGFRAGRV